MHAMKEKKYNVDSISKQQVHTELTQFSKFG